MDFTVEFYVSAVGVAPVREFLDELKQSDPGAHAAVLRGLAKLRDRQYHREPLSKSLVGGLFELRHVRQVEYAGAVVLCERPAHNCRSWHPQQRPGRPGPRP